MTLAIETNKPSLDHLPANYLIALSDYCAISLSGEEKSKYLQGQVTCDVHSLEQHPLLHGAHCNAKGKVFSCFRLFNRDDKHLLLQPKSTVEGSLAELKKFGVFAKVEISIADNCEFIALVGEGAAEILKTRLSLVPDSLSPVVNNDSTTIIYIAGKVDRYVIIDSKDKLEEIVVDLALPIYENSIWHLLETIEGIPTLVSEKSNEYVPQMLNMQAINGISFTKGCYLGQETVARMQYLGKNKKALFVLSGNIPHKLVNVVIEKQLGENWRKAGDVTCFYQADDNTSYFQAVLNSDIDSTTHLRIKDHPETSLSIIDLPYTLIQE